MEPDAAGKVIGEKRAKPRQWQRVALGLAVVVLVVAATVVIWRLQFAFTSRCSNSCNLCRKFNQRQELVVDQGKFPLFDMSKELWLKSSERSQQHVHQSTT
jgi:hypothetical protein